MGVDGEDQADHFSAGFKCFLIQRRHDRDQRSIGNYNHQAPFDVHCPGLTAMYKQKSHY